MRPALTLLAPAAAALAALSLVAAATSTPSSGATAPAVPAASAAASAAPATPVVEGDSPLDDSLGEYTGGATTVFAVGRNAFSFPAANLSEPERTRFVIGNSFFKRNWVQAPSSTRARDGLGPHFIARSCGGCHVTDGRGSPPEVQADGTHESPVSLLFRLSVPGAADPRLGVRPEPTYGDQLDNAAIPGVKPEGDVRIRWEPLQGRFDDGTPYTLRRPVYELTSLGYGPMAPGVMLSPRVAPQLIGIGLLEMIPEAEILANARQQASLEGPLDAGIRGVPNRVHDLFLDRMALGRFGWKANVATVAHQTAGAFRGDIGITSSKVPDESCTLMQKDCLAAPRGGAPGEPEIDDKTLADVVFYQAVLAPPARREPRAPQVLEGQQLFESSGCAVCHRPSYVTGPAPLPSMSSDRMLHQRIWPYTDLLLHDMGEDLADGRPDFEANGRQWRTPPLWGVGLIHDVNSHRRLLHDGRADGVLEAILWHGGEAEASKRHVLGLTAAQRDALVRFVESL